MKKHTLIKFYKGEATEQEIDIIIEWVNQSPQNKEYFAQLKAIHTATRIHSAIDIASGNRIYPDIFIGTQQQKKRENIGKRILYLSSAAAIAALFFALGYFTGPQQTVSGVENAVAVVKSEPVMRTLYTEKGVKGFIQLPDSSKVWLNSDSKIIYPEVFTGATRNVQISGEAYFEVKKDSLHPMIVRTNKDFAIEVLGTTFIVKSYENDARAEATLYTGAITMHYRNQKTAQPEQIKLKPNESFSYVAANHIPKQFNYKKPENQKAWKEGELIFDNTPMDEVFKILERWHGTTFIINNENIYKYKLSAEFSSESIVQIMEIVQLIMPLQYVCTNNVVTINTLDVPAPPRVKR